MTVLKQENINLPFVDEEIIQYLGHLPLNYWDFNGYEKDYTHDIHGYPAMMIPPISRNLINIIKRYQPIKNLFDPFAGSGTVLLEGILAGLNVWGIDLNPLACLIAKAKCTPINPDLLVDTRENIIENIASEIVKLDNGELDIDCPKFKKIDFWFKPYVIRHLQVIKNNINRIENKDIKIFLSVAFSATVRQCSNTRNNEFKLYRLPEEKLLAFNPSVLEVFKTQLDVCVKGMNQLYSRFGCNCNHSVTTIADDTRNCKLDTDMDLMITSPPYGDSRTTVAYGQYSRLSLQWLDLQERDFVASEIEQSNLDKYLLGGTSNKLENNLPSSTLEESILKISEIDEKRASEVLSFYVDLNNCLDSITKNMKVNSYQCWVVGNRTVKRVNIPTNKIISELSEQYNLITVTTVPRNIPNKRMPKENSPSNIRGQKVTTMNDENIIVTCPPKRSPVIMLVNWDKKGGVNGKENLHSGANH